MLFKKLPIHLKFSLFPVVFAAIFSLSAQASGIGHIVGASGASSKSMLGSGASSSSSNLISTLVVGYDSLCVDIPGSTSPGVAIDQSACTGGTNQSFLFSTTTGSLFTIQPQSSNLCLDSGGPSNYGGNVTQQTCNGSTTQSWQGHLNGDGSYSIATSDGTTCLNVSGWSHAGGASIVIWSCDGYPGNEDFLTQGTLPGVAAPVTTPASSSSLITSLVAQSSGLCIDIAGSANPVGVAADQYTCNGSTNQSFLFTSVTSTLFTIQPQNSNLCLDSGGASNYGGAITQRTCNGASTQQWQGYLNSDSTYSITTPDGGGCFNVAGGSTGNGGAIILWYCGNYTSNERFKTVAPLPNGTSSVSVTVTPGSASLSQSQTQSFSATVTGSSNTAVTWSIIPAVGSISTAGLYTAPSTISAAQSVTVTATSMADATKSASAIVSLTPPAAVVSVSVTPGSATLGQSQTQSFSAAVTGSSNTAVTWSISPAVGSISSSGLYTAPSSISTAQSVTVTAKSSADSTKSSSATVSLVPPVGISVNPGSATLSQSQTQSFSATITGSSNTAVTWAVSPSVGSISSTGLYTAPSTISAAQTVTVTATSAADTTKSASATVSLTPPASTGSGSTLITTLIVQSSNLCLDVPGSASTVGVAMDQYSCNGGTNQSFLFTSVTSTLFTIQPQNSNLCLDSGGAGNFGGAITQRTCNGGSTQQWLGYLNSDGYYSITTPDGGGCLNVSGGSTGNGGAIILWYCGNYTSNERFKTVAPLPNGTTPATVSVTVTPGSASLSQSQTQSFSAAVTGSSNTAVTWSISPAVGSISTAGLYTAPSTISAAQSVTVRATSAADATKSGSATVSLTPPAVAVSVTVSPGSVTLGQSQTQGFSASVTGSSNTAVTWSISPAVGSISGAGLYTAPSTISAAQTVTVKATSAADSTKSASATVSLAPPVGISVSPGSATLSQSQTQSFSATVTGSSNTAVTWSISPAVGSISSAGLYTAPSTISSAQSVTVTATSAADAAKSASGTVSLTPPAVTGGGASTVTTLIVQSSNLCLDVPGSASTSGVSMDQYACNGGTNQSFLLTSVTSALFTIQPQNSGLCLDSGGSSNFGGAITQRACSGAATQQWHGYLNADGTYSITTPDGGGCMNVSGGSTSNGGSIILWYCGNYTSNERFKTVAGVPNGTTAPVAVSVSVAPTSVSLGQSQTQTFTATVSGSSNTAVTWAVSPAVGSVSSAGLYTAPATISSAQTVTVTATSAADTSKTASATVSLTAPTTTPGTGATLTTSLIVPYDSYCVDLPTSSSPVGVAVDQSTCTGAANQSFLLTSVSSTLFTIQPKSTSLCLDSGAGYGGNVTQQTCSGATTQQWQSHANADGTYSFATSDGSNCLNVSGFSHAIGGSIIIWSCSGYTTNETFQIVGTPPSGSGTTSPTNPTNPTSPSGVLAGSKMGVNIHSLGDLSDTDHMFVNLVKSSRGFGTADYPYDLVGHPAPLGADGWPTGDFGDVLITTLSDPLQRPMSQWYPSALGTYQISFNGQATINMSAGVSLLSQQYNSATNTTTASISVTDNTSPGTGFYFALTFVNTRYDATHTGIKNLVINRPGYPLGTSKVFTDEFLNAIAPFANLRFMDAQCTNGSSVTSWSQRTTLANPVQTDCSKGGLSFEYIAQLANLTGKDVWVNIPAGVDLYDATSNNYVLQLATLLKATLNPGIHVYLEWSNEIWNNGAAFPQTHTNHCAAINETLAAFPADMSLTSVAATFNPICSNSSLSPANCVAPNTLYPPECTYNPSARPDATLSSQNSNTNDYYWGYRRNGRQAMLISNIFRSVYGDAAMMTTIRPVLAMQFVYQYLSEDILYYVQNTFGAPSKFYYGLAGAPYWQVPYASYTSVDSLMTALQGSLSSLILPDLNQGSTTGVSIDGNFSTATMNGLAHFYGLKSLSYEGGPDISLNTGNAAGLINEQSQSDARYATMTQQFYNQWFGCDNDLMNYWNLSQGISGQWGIYEDVTIPTTKSQAILQVANTPLSQLTSQACR